MVLGGQILLRGVPASMAEFAVPEETLKSPHYQDAIFWVYLHMVVIGLLTVVVGATATEDRLKRWYARALFAAHIVYTYLDARASDSFLGTGLYRGPGSVVPAIISLLVTILFAHVAFCDTGSRRPRAAL